MHAQPSPGVSPTAHSGGGVLLAVGGVVTVGVLPVFLVGGLAVQIRAELGLSVSLLGLAGIPAALSQPAANELLMARCLRTGEGSRSR